MSDLFVVSNALAALDSCRDFVMQSSAIVMIQQYTLSKLPEMTGHSVGPSWGNARLRVWGALGLIYAWLGREEFTEKAQQSFGARTALRCQVTCLFYRLAGLLF